MHSNHKSYINRALDCLYKSVAPIAIAVGIAACQPSLANPVAKPSMQNYQDVCKEQTNRLLLPKGATFTLDMLDEDDTNMMSITARYLGENRFLIGEKGRETPVAIETYPYRVNMYLRLPSGKLLNPVYSMVFDKKEGEVSVTVAPMDCLMTKGGTSEF